MRTIKQLLPDEAWIARERRAHLDQIIMDIIKEKADMKRGKRMMPRAFPTLGKGRRW